MEEGPPIRAVAGRLIKQPSAAVVKSYGSERVGKRLQKQSCVICKDERK